MFSRVLDILKDPWKRQYYLWIPKYFMTPRYAESRIILPDGTPIWIADFASFFSTYKTVFVDRSYDFLPPTKQPHIVICGENIGVSLFFFKREYPGAHVTAFEADPYIFSLLQRNVKLWKLSHVTIHNCAVWTENTTLQFQSDHADGGRVNNGLEHRSVRVKAISLADFLKKHPSTTFINIDIEGAENKLLTQILPFLIKIPYVFIEYHSMVGEQQHIGELVSGFEQAGYRMHMKPEFYSFSPFMQLRSRGGMDMQLNFFAWKK